MSDATPCPVPDDWQHHLDGTLPAARENEMTAHLSGCLTCQKTVETLAAGGDTLLNVAGQVGREPADATPALRDVLANVPNPFAEPTVKGRADVDFSFLEPPTTPGELGRLGHYAVLQLIGRGGFGLVFRAFDKKLRRIVAIKVLAPELAAHAVARRRFIREAQAVAAVRNEYIIAIFEVQDTHQPPYLVMEFIEGQSLQAKLDRVGALGPTEILRIGTQMAEGLAAAHKLGLIHRDIKPANILLENGVERVKITDFGLARAADDATMTHSGTIAGTPAYMSPEQAHGETVDARSDLFSLGSVLYAMAAGHAPFRASSAVAVLLRVAEKEAKPLKSINPDAPDWLVQIIAKLHAKKPDARYQSAREVADCLSQWLAHLQQPSTTPRPAAPKRAAARRFTVAEGTSGRRIALMLMLFIVPAFLLFGCFSSFLWYAAGRADPRPVAAAEGPTILAARRNLFNDTTVVDENDVFVRRVEESEMDAYIKNKHKYLRGTPKDVVGLVLTRPVAANEPLRHDYFRDPDRKADEKKVEVITKADSKKVTEAKLPTKAEDLSAASAEDVLAFLARSDPWEASIDSLLPLPGEVRESNALVLTNRVVGDRYLRMRTHALPNNLDLLQFISFDQKRREFQSWLFDSNGEAFGPLKGNWNPDTQTLTLISTNDSPSRSVRQTLHLTRHAQKGGFLYNRVDGVLRVTLPAPKVTTGMTWKMFNRSIQGLRTPFKADEPSKLPKSETALKVHHGPLGRLAGEYLVDVVRKPMSGKDDSERTIVRTTWAKSLDGLVMEGYLHDAVTGESQCLLAYFDNHANSYQMLLLPHKGLPSQGPGTHSAGKDKGPDGFRWDLTSADGSRTEMLWQLDASGRCDWMVKKWDSAKVLIHDSVWVSRDRTLPILPLPEKVSP
jgi:hypothetical protein